MNNITELITEILSTISIRYISNTGNILPVKYDRLAELLPIHSKVTSRIYIEQLGCGGVPSFKIIGVITTKTLPEEVTGMTLTAEYTDKEGCYRQIWINNTDLKNVRVIIPTQLK